MRMTMEIHVEFNASLLRVPLAKVLRLSKSWNRWCAMIVSTHIQLRLLSVERYIRSALDRRCTVMSDDRIRILTRRCIVTSDRIRVSSEWLLLLEVIFWNVGAVVNSLSRGDGRYLALTTTGTNEQMITHVSLLLSERACGADVLVFKRDFLRERRTRRSTRVIFDRTGFFSPMKLHAEKHRLWSDSEKRK